MEVSVFCPHTQTVLAVWVLADHGSIVDDCNARAQALETVADVAIQRYHDRSGAAQSRGEPDVRDC